MARTFEDLKQSAIQIRDEKTNKQNTATRIGTQMLAHLDKLEQDYLDKETTEGKFSELQESSVSNSFFNKFVSDFFIDISNYNGDLPLSGNLYITRFGDDVGFKTITISNTPTFSNDTIVAQYYNKTEDTGFIETTHNGILIQANVISWPERENLNSALIKPKAFLKNKTLNDYFLNSEVGEIKKSTDKFSSIFSFETKNEAGNKPSDLIRYIRFIPTTEDKTKFKITRAQITRCSYYNGSPVCVVNYGVIDEDANPLIEVNKDANSSSYNAEKREFIINLMSLTMIVGLNQDVPNASDKTWVWETNKYPCPINSPLFSLAENSVEKDYMYIKPNYNSQQVTDGYLDQNTGGITDLDGKNGCITNFVQIDKGKIQDGYVILCKESDRVCYYSSNTEESFISGKYFGLDINWNILVDEDIINNTNIEYFRTYISNNYQVNIWYVKKEDIEAFKLGLFKIPGLYITVLDEMLADTKLRKDVDKLGIEPIAENLIDRTTLSLQKSYINPDTGTYDTSSAYYASQTSFQKINSGTTLYFSNVRSVAFYSSDSESSFISGINYPNSAIKSPDNATYMRYSLYDTNYNDITTYIIYGDKAVDLSKIKLNNVLFDEIDDIVISKQIISLLQSDVTPKGKAKTGDAIPEDLLFKDAYLAAENGTIFGKENVAEGELLIYQGFENFDVVNKKIENATEVLNFDVVIIGCGSAGMGAAYALKDSGYKVCLVDKLAALGGTATRAGINTWIESANPSFFVDIFETLKSQSKATGDINSSILPNMFRTGNTGGAGLVIDTEALSAKYKSDMDSDSNITILLEHEFISIAKSVNGILESIYIQDKNARYVKQINAKWFIDTSGDAVLCRSACPIVGVDYFYGRDARSVYNESIAPAKVSDNLSLNEPTQYFQISSAAPDDTELLDTISTVYRSGDTIVKPDYIYEDGYESANGWVNSMAGMVWSEGGRIVLQAGANNTMKVMKEKRALEYWKYIKLTAKLKQEQGESRFGGWSVDNVLSKNWTGNFTEYIGIRETFRIACDAMLTQNDLGKTILASDLQDYISEGSHIIDFHVKDGLSIDELNKWNGEGSYKGKQLLRPYGIRYGSLIPKRLNNVWVAGRCSGMSQIAAASARVNKLCSQLGWAAGNAAKMALKKSLKNTRDVSISELQGSTYTNFIQSITDMNELLDSKWKL